MIRDHWRELAFWRWWWRTRVPIGAKACVVFLVLAALVGGGWFASGGLPSAGASDSRSVAVVSTVERVVTIRGRERVVARRVPVVRTVYLANRAGATRTVGRVETVIATNTVYRTVSTPGNQRTRTVSRVVTVTRTRPLSRLVTVTKDRPVSRVVTVTQTRPVTTTSVRTETQWRVISVVQKPATVTVTVTNP